ncbi:carbohydrate kinase [Peptoniphilus mikwangii]|uniref:carbohydrate kinase n=1 Tax=Peptoniphilus mikwangii TaxID=1354300 RepID=UPI000685C8F3|nr:carbohydrate kinase [Peptoniphilus mikwangii]
MIYLTPRENEIMQLIKKNPAISQQEIADLLNIKRSSVAAHIKNLSSQGYILGRQYVLRDEPYVVVVGGANVDIVGYSDFKLIKNDSNPGRIIQSTGGVGRNIAENISRLNVRTSIISVIGDDDKGRFILNELNSLGIESDSIFVMHDCNTSVYLAILDENRDMDIAINDMEIINKLTPELIEKKQRMIENAICCIVDTNLTRETLEFLFKNINQKYFVDCVSVNKAEKLEGLLNNVYFLKANKYEAEFLSKVKIDSLEDAKKSAKKIIEQGVNSVVITMGDEGSLYADEKDMLHVSSNTMDIVNASGAGDAFMAGYVYSYIKDYKLTERMKFATASSRIALMSEKTNSEKFTVKNIEGEVKNVK